MAPIKLLKEMTPVEAVNMATRILREAVPMLELKPLFDEIEKLP